MKIFEKLLQREEFIQKPLVLVDIGASGSIQKDWKSIAKHSICFAFDADDRDIEYLESETKGFKRLIVVNNIVSANNVKEEKFFLTRSPHCSSLLKPDTEKLNTWEFHELFEVEKITNIQSVQLPDVLKKFDIDYIDWFKTDSQGTDLRLFHSIGERMIPRVIITEFEPGIIDAYIGEDKLHQLMQYMDGLDFWMADIKIKGSQKISEKGLQILAGGWVGFVNKLVKRPIVKHVIKSSPGWGEVCYLNRFNNDSLDKRDYLLGWIFATIKKQYGFALDLALKGHQLFDDGLFLEMKQYSVNKINMHVLSLPFRYFISKFNKT